MATADLRGTPLHYLCYGSGPALLLIHGLGSSGEDWAFQLPDLSDHFRVIVADLRGSGRSGKPTGPYSIGQFADDMWLLLDQLEIASVNLVGFSLGGAVALEMALQRPAQCQRLVLINALPSYRVNSLGKWCEAHLHILLVRLLGLPRTARMIARRLFPLPHQLPMRRRVEEVVGANPQQPYLDTVRALVGWCAEDRLTQLQARCLLLCAEFDYTSLPEKQQWASRLQALMVVVRGSRHGTPFDSVRASNACLLAFLRDQPLPPDSELHIDDPEQAPSAAPAPPPESTHSVHM